ncbi:MAG: addiction module protein [bacterium]|nr:addiction module protein [bacterium]
MMNSKIAQITDWVLSLPVAERAFLAQKLWESLEEYEHTVTTDDEMETLIEAKRRDAELSENKVAGHSHEEVMEAAYKAIQCD